MEPIALTYTPIKEDYIIPLRTHWMQRPLFIIAFAASGLLALMMLGISLLIVISALLSGTGSDDVVLSLICAGFPLIFAVALGAIPLLYWGFVPASGGRLFQKDERYRAETTMTLDDTGVRITTPFEEHKVDWSHYQQIREIKDYYLLVARTIKFAIRAVPKRAFASPDDESAFRELVQSHLGPIQ